MITMECIEETVSCCTLVELDHEVRVERILDTRRKLRTGKYNINKKLNIAMDRLLEEILG